MRIEVADEFAQLDTRWNLHPIPTNGFKLTFGGRTLGYSGDTQYDPAMLEDLRRRGTLAESQFEELMYFFWTPDGKPTVDLLYHEAGIPPIHTDKEALRALPDAITSRISLVHIADGDVPPGFAPGKPRLFATQVLLPPTPRSRRRVLLETMRSVAYLYDIPSDTLETLLHGAEVVTHFPDEVIIREGPVAPGEPVHFQIIADGRVSVRDGRRVVTTLGRADTFGEWGISHQSGFRAADVVADRLTQTIRLSAEQYHWLVGKHPVIQERVSKIRRLLPRLQLAQERARLKAALEPGGQERDRAHDFESALRLRDLQPDQDVHPGPAHPRRGRRGRRVLHPPIGPPRCRDWWSLHQRAERGRRLRRIWASWKAGLARPPSPSCPPTPRFCS